MGARGQLDDSGVAPKSEAGRRARERLSANADGERGAAHCCPFYHEAVELIGRRWTGAILRVLMGGPLRFSEIAQAVPELSDRLLSERMKELEARGMVERRVLSGPPLRVEYQLSRMGLELEPALSELQQWANRWLRRHPGNGASASRGQRVTQV
jgi:DNA-binding HxlR family transcriptional regulator